MRWCVALLLIGLLSACRGIAAAGPKTPEAPASIFAAAQRLGRGVNFGNALEAPREGEWGVSLSAELFELARQAGFDSIRLPISWGYHLAPEPPYTIDPAFLRRVDWAIAQALARGLAIVINHHHDDALNADPLAERERFLAIWRQLAEHYREAPEEVYFELLNEPHGAFNDNPELWNQLLAEALAIVRQHHPTRPVIIGPVGWNSLWRLPELRLPDDPYLIVTIHYYEPFAFTHQGASWVGYPPTGVSWHEDDFALLWDDWSWDTRVIPVSLPSGTALEIRYQRQWAGFYLHSPLPAIGYDTLVLRSDRAVALELECGSEPAAVQFALDTRPDFQPTELDISACGPLSDLKLKNRSAELQPFRLRELTLRGEAGELALLGSASELVRWHLKRAHSWAAAQHRPLYLGEFGAYSAGELTARVRWTRTVREASEALGWPWAYWEFAAGFGIYDLEARAWREPLWRALIPAP